MYVRKISKFAEYAVLQGVRHIPVQMETTQSFLGVVSHLKYEQRYDSEMF